jgi:hypothetical protein
MASEADYRPAAPSDGLGHVLLTEDEVKDPDRLEEEAWKYAKEFAAEDDSRRFNIGCTNYSTNKATVYTIEAARSLCGGANELAAVLLRMALAEVERSLSERAARDKGNPLTGTWTKRDDKSGKFVEVRTNAKPFKGERSER